AASTKVVSALTTTAPIGILIGSLNQDDSDGGVKVSIGASERFNLRVAMLWPRDCCVTMKEINMAQIPLHNGKIVLVDDEDYETLSSYTWWAEEADYTYYART